jgi:hypothetical protein
MRFVRTVMLAIGAALFLSVAASASTIVGTPKTTRFAEPRAPTGWTVGPATTGSWALRAMTCSSAARGTTS